MGFHRPTVELEKSPYQQGRVFFFFFLKTKGELFRFSLFQIFSLQVRTQVKCTYPCLFN